MPSSPGPAARRAAVLLVVTDDGRLLLHLRDDRPDIVHPGCWAGFGGAVEGDETVEEAVRREMREETGVEVVGPVFLTEALDPEGSGRLVSVFYVVGGITLEDIDLQEGAGVGIHSLDDLEHLRMSPFVRRAIDNHLVPALGLAPAPAPTPTPTPGLGPAPYPPGARPLDHPDRQARRE